MRSSLERTSILRKIFGVQLSIVGVHGVHNLFLACTNLYLEPHRRALFLLFSCISDLWNSKFSSTMVKVFTMQSHQNPLFSCISGLWNSKFSSTMVKVFTMQSHENHSFSCISDLWNSRFSSTMVKIFTVRS